jgi:hypothetical protein
VNLALVVYKRPLAQHPLAQHPLVQAAVAAVAVVFETAAGVVTNKGLLLKHYSKL